MKVSLLSLCTGLPWENCPLQEPIGLPLLVGRGARTGFAGGHIQQYLAVCRLDIPVGRIPRNWMHRSVV